MILKITVFSVNLESTYCKQEHEKHLIEQITFYPAILAFSSLSWKIKKE
jgi:hypothetical protein